MRCESTDPPLRKRQGRGTRKGKSKGNGKGKSNGEGASNGCGKSTDPPLHRPQGRGTRKGNGKCGRTRDGASLCGNILNVLAGGAVVG